MKVVGVDDSNRTTMITNIVAHWYICLVESVKWRKKPYELGRIRKINGRKGEGGKGRRYTKQITTCHLDLKREAKKPRFLGCTTG